jgi:lycopene beta-cyclase
MAEFDYVLVGGGLQNGLIASALRTRRPESRIALIERESALGGNHTWCFHEADVAPDSRAWLEPFVVHAWPGYRVVFPRLQRTIDGRYSAVTSERLDEVASTAVRGGPGSKLFLDTEVSEVDKHVVTLSSGGRLEGRVVIDSRGPPLPSGPAAAGYQKFLGLELELARPHDLDRPVLMDATVDQSEGYRFFYILPLGPSRLLVEDTYFHEDPSLDRGRLRDGVLGYATSRDWKATEIVREEVGVLPMPWAGSPDVPRSGPLLGGYGGGWFHPGTGYSFPVAARLAEFVAGRPPTDLFGADLHRFAGEHIRQVLYVQLLNRFLFRWFPPSARIAIFERFYRLPKTTIGHFYALRLTWLDALRLITLRPPRGLSLRHRLRQGREG